MWGRNYRQIRPRAERIMTGDRMNKRRAYPADIQAEVAAVNGERRGVTPLR